MSSPSTPSPFTINVADAVLRDLADRLPRTRFPERTVCGVAEEGAEEGTVVDHG